MAACHAALPTANDATRPGVASAAANVRFVKLNSEGKPIENQISNFNEQHWNCVLDHHTQLIWEIKQTHQGPHARDNRYAWYDSDSTRNGGHSGSPSYQSCEQSVCNTEAFIALLNANRFCGKSDWRLPTREELRSLVDYGIHFPGPTINHDIFPNTRSEFYWSANSDAEDQDSAWGIGFSFGYDYSYLKVHAAYVRAVSDYRE